MKTNASDFQLMRRLLPWGTAAFVAVVVLLVAAGFERAITARHIQEIRADTVRDLAAMRGAAEIAINKRVHLTLGLKAHVSVNPDMSEQEFADIAALLMAEAKGIRSVTSIKDNVINDVYPREGNQGAVGLRLLDHPEQRVAALHAIETGKPWLAGPVSLVQGGEAFVHRAPVYVATPGESPGIGKYWGMVSVLIDKELLLSEIESARPEGLRFAIRGRNGRGEPGDLLMGDEDVVLAEPILTEITLPTGSWQVYGMPQTGWPTQAPDTVVRSTIAAVFMLVSSSLAFLVVFAIQRYRDYTRDMESTAQELEQKATLLQQSNRDLDDFAYVASHDLRTPLEGIKNLASWIREDNADKLSSDSTRHLQQMDQRVRRMDKLLEDLLQYSRIGRREGEAEWVCTDELVREAVNLLNVPAEYEVITEDLPRFRTHRPPLEQVFRNLIDNSVKHQDQEHGKIRVTCKEHESVYEFTVADDGPGIPAEFHDRVFGLFETLRPRDEVEGSGMGLAMIKKTVERYFGTVELEPVLPRGVAFRFTWPKRIEEEKSLGETNG